MQQYIYILESLDKQLITFLLLLVLTLVTDEDTVKRYYAKFEERFFQTCEKEILKINTFYSGIYSTSLTFQVTIADAEYISQVRKAVSDQLCDYCAASQRNY